MFVLVCCVTSLVFTLLIIPSVMKNPAMHIMSYPPEIRARVESLPQYKDTIGIREEKHKKAKLASVAVFAIVLAILCYFIGYRTFATAALHTFLLFLL